MNDVIAARPDAAALMKPDLGCLSELAAKCLQSLAVERHPIFQAQEEQLRKENDVAIAMLAIKPARMEDRGGVDWAIGAG